MVHQGLLYALGLAQQKYGLLLHGEVFMPNHVHLLVTDTRANLPQALEFLFGNTSRFIKCSPVEYGFES